MRNSTKTFLKDVTRSTVIALMSGMIAGLIVAYYSTIVAMLAL